MRTFFILFVLCFFTKASSGQETVLSIELDRDALKLPEATGQSLPENLYFTQSTAPGGTWDHFHGSSGYMWFAAGGGLFRFDGTNVKAYLSDPLDTNSLSCPAAYYITEGKQGKYWISTFGCGLNSFDSKTETFQHFRHDVNDTTSISTDLPAKLLYDSEGMLWIGFDSEEGLNRFDPTTGRSERFSIRKGKKGHLQGKVRGRIIEDGNRIYLGSTAGLEYYDKETGLFHYLPILDKNQDTIAFNPFAAICKSRDGKIWIGTPSDGLRFYDPATNSIQTYKITTAKGQRLTAGVRKIIEDKAGNLWIWAWGEIWSLSADRQVLMKHNVLTIEDQKPMNIGAGSGHEGGIFMDNYGTIWFQNYYFDTRRNLFEYHLPFSKKENKLLRSHTIYYGDEDCVYSRGSNFLYDLKSRTTIPLRLGDHWLKQNRYIGEDTASLNNSACKHCYDHFLKYLRRPRLIKNGKVMGYGFMKKQFDQDGDLWIATWGQGLIHIKKEALEESDWTLSEFNQWLSEDDGETVPTNKLLWLLVDSRNDIWVAGNYGGLTRVNKEDMTFERFDYQQGSNGVAASYTMQIAEDDEENIWITTNTSGLNKFNLKTREFSVYNTKNGLLANPLFSVGVDKEGWVWVNSSRGLASFDPSKEQFINYGKKDGLLGANSIFYLNRELNVLYLPVGNGFYVIDLNDLKNRPTQSSAVKITGVKIYDPEENTLRAVLPNKYEAQTLELSYLENILDIGFAVIDFRNADKHEYQYALTQGGEPNWINIGNQTQVNLNQLNPGTYHFHLKGCNSDKIWTELETPLRFTILPPWWRTNWAYLAYGLLLGVGIYGFYRFQLTRRIAQAEARQLKELDEVKTRFFTNITHEFRTPLTVIMGISDELELNSNQLKILKTEKQKIKLGHTLIQRNSKNLLRLVNQLLDLSKLDSGSMKMDAVQADVVNFLRYLTESFHSMAAERNQTLHFQSEIPELVMDFDEVKLQHIIYNLLSNAIKFTPKGGSIDFRVNEIGNNGDSQLEIKVRDTGIGIAAEQLPFIFDRFYQTDSSTTRKGEGTGIGLALTKELVEMMGGQIHVHSSKGQGATFTVLLPVKKELPAPAKTDHLPLPKMTIELASEQMQDLAPTLVLSLSATNDERPQLLIIEDNPDVVAYMKALLVKEYIVETAADGEVGIDKAINQIPDIIITDVMMPGKDGFEVCRTLKTDERTSHIPIIMLTAKAADEDKISGLQTGADVYLMKPFNRDELFVRLRKLIELRKKLREKYSYTTSPVVEPSTSTIPPSPDDIFMQKIHLIIEEKIGDADFGISHLCESTHLSNTQVFRKMKALTGLSPIRFIQKIRLHRAKELIEQTELNISEIAYDLGFTDPNYFSRAFRKEFGVTPSGVRE